MNEVKKLDMAVEQLEDALETYFEGRYHSATSLPAWRSSSLQTVAEFDLPVIPLAQRFVLESIEGLR